MKKKPSPQKFCSWVVEARWKGDELNAHDPRILKWHRIRHEALAGGRLTYNLPSNKESRLMPKYPLEELIREATEEVWSPYYEFRFKNVHTKETIPFALFPEINFDTCPTPNPFP